LSKCGGKLHPSPKNISDVFILIIFYFYYLFSSFDIHHPTLITLSAVKVLYPPIKTVKSPKTMLPPCAVLSPKRAAGIPPISTDDEPIIIESGGPAHVAISPTLAAGIPPIKTVGSPVGNIGPPTWGLSFGFVTGQMCISFILAAGGIIWLIIYGR
jgi:hypothetical protein